MTHLEGRYRRVLRLLLPAAYLREWEDEMVATFLESVRVDDPDDAAYLADFGHPSWSETASVAALAVRLRLGTARLRLGAGGASPRDLAWGEAARTVALVGVLAHAVAAGVQLANRLWLAGSLPWRSPLRIDPAQAAPADPWQLAAGLAGFVWVAAYLALVLGERRVGQLLALAAAAVGLVAPVAATVGLAVDGAPSVLLTMWSGLLLDVLLLLALLAFHRDAPPVRPRPWLTALGIGVVVVPAVALTAQPVDRALPLLDWPGLCCVALVAAAVVLLAGSALRRRGPALSWSLGLAVLAAATLGLRLATLLDYLLLGPFPGRGTVLATGAAEAVAVLCAGLPLAGRSVCALRRLPRVPASPPTATS
jgi:hypothetical protein